MKRLFAIGEALIDMIPSETGCDFSDVQFFAPQVGGAPANVAGAFARLGGESVLLTQLGDDPFGHKIEAFLRQNGVDTRYIRFTSDANTSLAFVTLASDGNRTFSFYRNPGADQLYPAEAVNGVDFSDAYALHFCSVALTESPMRAAHEAALRKAAAAGAILSFDVNLRFPLWPDPKALYDTVWSFLPQAHILKLSDEELPFLTGSNEIRSVLPKLLCGQVQLILYTCGAGGAWAFTAKQQVFAPAKPVSAVDTTGAGDAFVASFLFGLGQMGISREKLGSLSDLQLGQLLQESNAYCAESVQHTGAIASYPVRRGKL